MLRSLQLRGTSEVASSSHSSRVLVYNGKGAGLRCALSAKESLEEALHRHGAKVSFISTEQLLREDGLNADGGCDLLCMPGGADLPYCKDLQGPGNQIIREWVESGGAYLGLCAGAYYACSRCIFEPGSNMEVVGDRELALFPGHASGAVFPGFDYRTERGAAAAPVAFCPASSMPLRAVQQDSSATATGPGSRLGASPGPGSDLMTSSEPELWAPGRESWAQCLDYSNGGPMFLNHQGGKSLDCYSGQVQVLATYLGPGERVRGAAAAVRCTVGKGVAVLCGTHPELHHRWLHAELKTEEAAKELAQVGPTASKPDGKAAPSTLHARASMRAHVQALATQLEREAEGRQAFWRLLLLACLG